MALRREPVARFEAGFHSSYRTLVWTKVSIIVFADTDSDDLALVHLLRPRQELAEDVAQVGDEMETDGRTSPPRRTYLKDPGEWSRLIQLH